MTMAGSKGLSAHHVIVLGCDDVNMSYTTPLTFFVALTRARESLHLNEACRKAGCAEGKLWSVGFGKANECVVEYDYADLASLDQDVNKFQSAAEVMAVFRRGLEVGAPEHWPWTELLIEAPALA
jgi:superfamily I DNA/RNA helicase